MLVKRLYMLRVIAPWLIATESMGADILTKAMHSTGFFQMRGYLLNSGHAPRALMSGDRALRGKAARLWHQLLRALE